MSNNAVNEAAAAASPISVTRVASVGVTSSAVGAEGTSRPALSGAVGRDQRFVAVRPAEVEALVRQVIARYGRVPGEVVAMRRPLDALGVDFFALIDVVMDLESHLRIELDPDEVLSWLTAADIVESVEARLASAGARRGADHGIHER